RTFVDQDVLDADLSGQIRVHNSTDSLYFSADGMLENIRVENGEMDTFSFSALIENEWLDVELESIHEEQSLFEATATVPFIPGDPQTFDDQFFDRAISGSIILQDSDIGYWLSFVPIEFIEFEEPPTGTISFDGTVTGEAGMPEFEGDFEMREANLSGVEVDLFRTAMLYNHEEGKFSVDGNLESLEQEILVYDATVPFKLDLREFEVLLPDDDDNMSANIEAKNFDLAIFNDFVDRNMVRQIAGKINGNVSIAGTLENLEPSGNLELVDGNMRIVEAGINLTDIGTTINFREDNIEIEQFSMESGPGRLRANGNIAIENLTPGGMDITIRAEQFRAANTSEYNATVDLDTRITGSIDEPLLSGSLRFLNGFVNLQNFGDRSVEEVRLEDEDEEEEPVTFYEDLAIEMSVNFSRQFFIRNRQFLDMEIELGGEVDLLKEQNADLEMFGQVEGVRGYARPLGRNFVIDEATVTFSGPVDNPELNVRTVYEPPQDQTNVRIFYIIEGSAQDPSFRFESEPQMELEDIIGYTVFGKPFYELESWEQMVAGSGGGPSATDVAMDVLLDRVEMLASQRLGIDVVQIDNSRAGSSNGTSITTGWYLNRRTFFALVNELDTNPKTLFILEYMLAEHLELILTQGNDSREGIDLRWQYDY
ncbi:MAG: translocation/assembly module TamB domain-containing protein, partial [Balneolaceae bacterium]